MELAAGQKNGSSKVEHLQKQDLQMPWDTAVGYPHNQTHHWWRDGYCPVSQYHKCKCWSKKATESLKDPPSQMPIARTATASQLSPIEPSPPTSISSLPSPNWSSYRSFEYTIRKCSMISVSSSPTTETSKMLQMWVPTQIPAFFPTNLADLRNLVVNQAARRRQLDPAASIVIKLCVDGSRFVYVYFFMDHSVFGLSCVQNSGLVWVPGSLISCWGTKWAKIWGCGTQNGPYSVRDMASDCYESFYLVLYQKPSLLIGF